MFGSLGSSFTSRTPRGEHGVPLPAAANARDDSSERWDRANVHAFSGAYGDYLLSKVSKVFPELARSVDA